MLLKNFTIDIPKFGEARVTIWADCRSESDIDKLIEWLNRSRYVFVRPSDTKPEKRR